MPNWCYTEYTFKGEPDEIDLFHKKIDQWSKNNTNSCFHADNGFGDGWLGNIINECMQSPEAFNTTKCRGRVIYNKLCSPDKISITTETAWCAAPLMWLIILKKMNLSSIKMAFYEEEPDMGVFTIYDPGNIVFGDNEYRVDIYGDVPAEFDISDEMVSKNKITAVINKIMPGNESLDSKIQELHDNYECSINKIDRIYNANELLKIYGDKEKIEDLT